LIDKIGEIKYNRSVKYYDKYVDYNNLTSFKIFRQNSDLGKQYPVIEASIKIDDQLVFRELVKEIKFTNRDQRLHNKYEDFVQPSITAFMITIIVIFMATRQKK